MRDIFWLPSNLQFNFPCHVVKEWNYYTYTFQLTPSWKWFPLKWVSHTHVRPSPSSTCQQMTVNEQVSAFALDRPVRQKLCMIEPLDWGNVGYELVWCQLRQTPTLEGHSPVIYKPGLACLDCMTDPSDLNCSEGLSHTESESMLIAQFVKG